MHLKLPASVPASSTGKYLNEYALVPRLYCQRVAVAATRPTGPVEPAGFLRRQSQVPPQRACDLTSAACFSVFLCRWRWRAWRYCGPGGGCRVRHCSASVAVT
jgi:hypothetical protein